jgi:trans-aconitate methyltransferase
MIGALVMSQLDFHIEQKIAQRDSIDLAARRLAGRPGWIVEFGLGRGRSYSHLVARFPDREIYCFDREHARPILAGAHPSSASSWATWPRCWPIRRCRRASAGA